MAGRQDDSSSVTISRTVSTGVLTSVITAILLAVGGSGMLIRDGLRDNTKAVQEQAQATANLATAVQQLQARFAAKDLKDAQQDYQLADHDKQIVAMQLKLLRLR